MQALLIRYWPLLAGVAALAAFVSWIDHRAAERTRTEMEAIASRIENQVRTDLRQSEQRLAGTIHTIDRTVHDQIDAIEVRHTTEIRPTLTKELTRETRYSDPAAGISDGVRAEINRALAAVACSARADGGIDCAMRGGRAAGHQ